MSTVETSLTTAELAPPLRIGPEDDGRPMTREEFATVGFSGSWKYERVNGRLVVTPPAGAEHRRNSKPFRRELGGYWAAHPDIVDEVDYEGWVATSEDDDRLPDICLYLVGPQSRLTVPDRIPDTVYEVVSKGWAARKRDFIEKRAEYHRAGIPRYVIIDRFRKQVHVLTWQEGDYAEEILGVNDVYSNPQLPGLRIALREVFAE